MAARRPVRKKNNASITHTCDTILALIACWIPRLLLYINHNGEYIEHSLWIQAFAIIFLNGCLLTEHTMCVNVCYVRMYECKYVRMYVCIYLYRVCHNNFYQVSEGSRGSNYRWRTCGRKRPLRTEIGVGNAAGKVGNPQCDSSTVVPLHFTHAVRNHPDTAFCDH